MIIEPLIQSLKLNQSLVIISQTVVVKKLESFSSIYFLLFFIFLDKWYNRHMVKYINKKARNKRGNAQK